MIRLQRVYGATQEKRVYWEGAEYAGLVISCPRCGYPQTENERKGRHFKFTCRDCGNTKEVLLEP